MSEQQHRFLISYIQDNQPKNLSISSDAESLSTEEARVYIENSPDYVSATDITDIEVTSIHHPLRRDVHPGHFQQPEGN